MEASIDFGDFFCRRFFRTLGGIVLGLFAELFSRAEPRFHCAGAVFRKVSHFCDLFGFGSVLHQISAQNQCRKSSQLVKSRTEKLICGNCNVSILFVLFVANFERFWRSQSRPKTMPKSIKFRFMLIYVKNLR